MPEVRDIETIVTITPMSAGEGSNMEPHVNFYWCSKSWSRHMDLTPNEAKALGWNLIDAAQCSERPQSYE